MGFPTRCLRILYVDDHADTLSAMERLLRPEGHTVVTAASCLAAREAAEGEPFDLLITDAGLLDGDGLKLLAELRVQYPVRGIVVSGYDAPADVAHSVEAGFARHLSKPIEFVALTKVIADVVALPVEA